MSHTDTLRSMLTITTDGTTDNTVSLGWMTLAYIEEEDGKWFITMRGEKNPIDSNGWDTVDAAVERLIKYLAIDS